MTDTQNADSGRVINHGTNGAYRSGCRCPDCRAAAATHMRNWRWRTGRNRPRAEYLRLLHDQHVHGTHVMYKKDRCRCEICKAWNRGFNQGYRYGKNGRLETGE